MPGNEFFGAEPLQGNVYFMSSGTLKLGSCPHLDLPLLPWCSWKEPTHVPQLLSPSRCPPAHCPGWGSRCRHSVGARVLAGALRKCLVNIWNLFLRYISLSMWVCFFFFFVLGAFLLQPSSCFTHRQKYWDVFGVVFWDAKQTFFLVKGGWLSYPSCLLKFFIHHFQS